MLETKMTRKQRALQVTNIKDTQHKNRKVSTTTTTKNTVPTKTRFFFLLLVFVLREQNIGHEEKVNRFMVS